jgi:CHAD domain-containing protein
VKSASSPSGKLSTTSLQPQWQRWLEAWRNLLAQCAHKPSRKSVHALRSRTLRLRVGFEYFLREQAAEPSVVLAFQRWSKNGKKLRKALEPVRDSDVYLARLDSLRNIFEGEPEGDTQLSPRCVCEIDKLETRLRQQRQVGIDKLVTVIDSHRKRLNRLSKEMEAAVAPHMPASANSTAQDALQIFAGLAGELPNLDASNLHTYRKCLKPALYLAEISAATDPLSRHLASTFRKIHNAVGEWHDWQSLALKAGRILPGHGKPDGLIPVLERLEEKALHRALSQCRRSAARLLKSVGEIQPMLNKKPVASDRGFPRRNENLWMAISG